MQRTRLTEKQVKLTLEDAPGNPYQVKVSYGKTGKDLNYWRVMGKEEAVFQHVEPLPPASKPNKIIFCAPSAGSSLQPVELVYLASLIQHRELYLCADPSSPLKGPYHSLAEFLADRSSIHERSEAEVKAALANQGKSPSNYLILDHKRYRDALGRLPRVEGYDALKKTDRDVSTFLREQLGNTLDLTSADNEDLERIAAMTQGQVEKIKVHLPTEAELERLFKLFPKLKTIEITGATAAWVNRGLPVLSRLNPKLNVIVNGPKSPIFSETYTIPAGVKLNELTIQNVSRLSMFSVQPDATLTKLKFVNCHYDFDYDLSELRGLKELRFEGGASYFRKLIPPRDNKIELLEVKNWRHFFPDTDCSKWTSLKKLQVVNSDTEFLSKTFSTGCGSAFERYMGWEQHGSLEEVVMMATTYQPADLDFSRCPQLKAVTHSSSANLRLPNRAGMNVVAVADKKSEEYLQPLYQVSHSWTNRGESVDFYLGGESNTRPVWSRLRHGYLNNFSGKTLYCTTVCPEMETLIITDCRQLKKVTAQGLAKVKNICIDIRWDSDGDNREPINLDFSSCPELQRVEISGAPPAPVKLNVTGCRRLRMLNANIFPQIIEIVGLSDCGKLREVSLNAWNAIAYKDQMPADCERQIYPPRWIENTYWFTPRFLGALTLASVVWYLVANWEALTSNFGASAGAGIAGAGASGAGIAGAGASGAGIAGAGATGAGCAGAGTGVGVAGAGAAGASHAAAGTGALAFFGNPIVLGVLAGSLVLCGLVYLLYRYSRNTPNTKPKAMTEDKKSEKKVEMSEEEKKKKAEEDKKKAAEEKEKKIAFDRYYETFKGLAATSTAKSLTDLLKDSSMDSDSKRGSTVREKPLSPLIELKPEQDPMMVNKHIIRHLAEEKIGDPVAEHIYIHSPKDFSNFLQPNRIEGGEKRLGEGPLMDILREEESATPRKKIVVVNWGHPDFKSHPEYIGACQSILDTPPYLTADDGIRIDIPKNVTIVGLISNASSAGTAFSSRCQKFTLDEEFFHSSEEKKQTTVVADEKKAIEVNLFNDPAWEEAVWGEINLEGESVVLDAENSPLMKAIRAKRPLVIHNPPNSDSYRKFVHDINDQRKILYNGELIRIPSKMTVVENQQPKPMILPRNVKVYGDERAVTDKKINMQNRICLGVTDLHQCYKELHIQGGNAKTERGGLLKRSTADNIICLNGQIPKYYWQKLMTAIEKSYPDKEFNFLLESGASIEELDGRQLIVSPLAATEAKRVATPEISIGKPATVYASNDPSFLTALLLPKEAKEGLVIDVHSSMSFEELFSQIVQRSGGGFAYDERLILEQLKKSSITIILNGEVSPALYEQLLPLLGAPKYFYSNGQRLEEKTPSADDAIQGKLILVVPQAKEWMQAIKPIERNFKIDGYQSKLKSLGLNPDKWLPQVKEFYKWVAEDKLAHRGDGRPKEAYLSFYRIVKMLEALDQERPVHPHNPIKGVFNFDYPEDSRESLYLNVLGKYIFRPEDKEPARVDKLKKIKEKLQIKSDADITKYVWHLLNCFNGFELREILGSSLKGAIEIDGFPSLSALALKKLKDRIGPLESKLEVTDEKRGVAAPVIPEAKAAAKKPRNQKQLAEIKALSGDDRNRLIILIGPPGIGKTRTLHESIGKFVEGEDKFEAWLKSDGSIPFVWDEINRAVPGSLEFLRGLARGDKRIVYKNVIYPLTNHRIYATCNPESDPGCYYHAVLQDIGVKVNSKEPTDEFYQTDILGPLLGGLLGGKFKEYSQYLVDTKNLIRSAEFSPFFVSSIRGVESAARRFIFLMKGKKWDDDTVLKKCLLKACEIEYGTVIKNADARAKFLKQLKTQLKITTEEESTHRLRKLKAAGISIPSSKFYVYEAVMQDLMMRTDALVEEEKKKSSAAGVADEKTVPVITHKQGVVLEGDPGVGKSTFMEAVVKQYKGALEGRCKELKGKEDLRLVGLSQVPPLSRDEELELKVLDREIEKLNEDIAVDSKKKSSRGVISVGLADARKLLIQLFKKGKVVRLEEANLDRNIDDLSNKLLTGFDDKGNLVHQPDYFSLGTQNDTAQEGRPDASSAALDRVHYIHFDTYTDEDYNLYAADKRVLFPDQLVAAFRQVSREYLSANTRTFHRGNDKCAVADRELAARVVELSTVRDRPFVAPVKEVVEMQAVNDRDRALVS